MKKISLSSTTRRSLLALSTLAGLSACGGGGGGDGNSAPTSGADGSSVPASAVASNAAFVRYLNTTPTNETQEPLKTDSVTPPTSDSEEPTDV